MKYEIIRSTKFKKNFKKLNTEFKDEVLATLKKLANDENLEPKYKDHQLWGEFKDFRECHIKPNLLLIYQKIENMLILKAINVGSHSELFKWAMIRKSIDKFIFLWYNVSVWIMNL